MRVLLAAMSVNNYLWSPDDRSLLDRLLALTVTFSIQAIRRHNQSSEESEEDAEFEGFNAELKDQVLKIALK
jgi:hypothetical protein